MARRDPVRPLLHGDPLKPVGVDLEALAARIGHAFARPELALEALTHRGALDRRPDLKQAYPYGNERLEFLGDRVLSLAMSQRLLKRFPGEGEGQIARRYAVLVSAKVLNEIAGEIELARFLIGDKGTPTPAILADLSVGGCGVLLRNALETGERIRVQLPNDPTPIIAVGTVIWVRKEQPQGRNAAQYRAGVQFTQVDQGAIEAFIIRRGDV